MILFRPILCALFAAIPTSVIAQTFGAPAETVIQGVADHLEIKPSSEQVSFTRTAEGITVTIKPGADEYPGITVTKKDGSPFDFSLHGHVLGKLTNLGSKNISVNLRLDNDGDWKKNPNNAESVFLEHGKDNTVQLVFGHSYGHKKSFPLDSSKVVRMIIYSSKSDVEQVFRIDSLITAGTPGELPAIDPASIRITPENGVIYTTDAKIDAEKQLSGQNNATASATADGIRGVFPGGSETGSITFNPSEGRWDLSHYLQVEVTLKNDGSEAVAPKVRLESGGGPSDSIAVEAIAPGATREVIIPFASKEIWIGDGDVGKKDGKGSKPQPGTKLSSDAISKVVISVENISEERSLLVTSVKASLPPTPTMPEWLGKKPPVEGDWKMTFDDDFNGTAIDATKWRVAAANYWDKESAFSKDNLIVEDGFAKLRYEKKTTRHNDEPDGKEFSYTTGFLDTYGKWTQRYGYFETRAKLPAAPGLWPAFWLMPDRGEKAGGQPQRQDTGNGGMEFDVIEHLTRWGPYRNNIAMHWDGYGNDHKAIGSSNIYFQPDKDGFVTVGVLWLPGKAAYYINGEEVARWETSRMSNVQSDLMYTLPQGGWDNNAVDDAQLPADFVIDYVRVWQREDLATPEDGAK